MSDDNENEQPLNLDIPDHLEYSEEHAWVDRSVDPAIIGITEYEISFSSLFTRPLIMPSITFSGLADSFGSFLI